MTTETADTISGRVLTALVGSGAVTAEQLETARGSAEAQGRDLDDVLRERGLIGPAQVEGVLENDLGMPRLDLASYAPETAALALVPGRLARSLGILPLFEIEGMLTVAMGDPLDVFHLDDLAERLGVEVEPALADPSAIAEALAKYYDESGAVVGAAGQPSEVATEQKRETDEAGEDETRAEAAAKERVADASGTPRAPWEQPEPPKTAEAAAEPALEPFAPAEGSEPSAGPSLTVAPAPRGALVDLDVLAVADARAVSVLVNHILERAVDRGAAGVHVLPYKDDFFLVLRVGGRLQKLGAAPRSLQRPLVDGFLALSRQAAPTGTPVTGRVRRHIRDRDVTLVMSLVPTLAGPRLVVTIEDAERATPSLDGLGLTEVEARALEGLVERGRGLVVLTSPAGEGRSTTYRALLAHAAAAGRTVYSVERDASVTLPAVAQVLADATPGSSAGTCLRAGLLQDTDIVALDDLETSRELAALLSAAARGKLAVLTVRADSVAAALGRLGALGGDGASLASTLTAVVAQRSARTVCEECATEGHDPAADRIAELGPSSKTRRGDGCAVCGGTGLGEPIALFEVRPATSALRRALVSESRKAAVRHALTEPGTRTVAEAALECVREGRVSAAEFERVAPGTGA